MEGIETVEQLGWRLPDHVVVPIASGSQLTKINKGFWELSRVGLVDEAVALANIEASLAILEDADDEHARRLLEKAREGRLNFVVDATHTGDLQERRPGLRSIRIRARSPGRPPKRTGRESPFAPT